jgi:3-oxoacyl-[acyl-carrier protein] reductase
MKTIVITGAGSGMGAATAKRLSQNPNHRIILIGRNEVSLQRTYAEMASPSNHVVLPVDITKADDLRKALSQAISESTIECVFANAGVGGENAYGENDRWNEIIQINLTGTYNTIMECYPYMQRSQEKFKHILITSSCLARFGVPNYTAYCTAKTGLLGLTRSLAVQWAREYILVNAITPGWVETDMAKAGIQLLANRAGSTYEESFNEQMGYVPTGRISQPEEIAAFVEFMFSGNQNSITGQALDINNGSYMQ